MFVMNIFSCYFLFIFHYKGAYEVEFFMFSLLTFIV